MHNFFALGTFLAMLFLPCVLAIYTGTKEYEQ